MLLIDTAAITVMMYASGNLDGSLGYLLLVTVAVAKNQQPLALLLNTLQIEISHADLPHLLLGHGQTAGQFQCPAYLPGLMTNGLAI
jgi:hypothetical protein